MNIVLALLLCFSPSFGIANAYQENTIVNYDFALQENAHQQIDLDKAIGPFADSVRMYSYYDRDAAINYAYQFYNRTCSDGVDFRIYGYGDCAHFVSCCIGNEGSQRGGGLSLGYHQKKSFLGGGYYYGWSGPYNLQRGYDLIPVLIEYKLAKEVSSIGELEPGDIIRYNIDNGHLALYLGNYLIADHHGSTPSDGGYYGKPYTIYSTSGIEYYHIYDNPPLPTPSKSFPIGGSVRSNEDGLNVREGPGTGSRNTPPYPDDYKSIGKVNKNSTGTVVAGPATLDGRYTWWLIQWSSTLIGWSAQDYLDLVSPPSKTLTSLDVSPSSWTFTSNTPKQFTATAYFSDGSSQVVTSSCSWSSENTSVATVSGGLVTPVSNGATRVWASYSYGGVTKSDYADITVNIPPPNPVLHVSPSSLTFSWELGSNPPSSQKIIVTNAGGGTLSWSAQINYGQGYGWLSVNPASDSSNNREVTVSVTPSGLTQGNYRGYITFIGASGTGNSPQIVTVDLAVSVPHTVSITNGPNATPNPVDPKGVVQLSVNAQDSWGHQLQYQWSVVSSSIGGGTFTNPNSAQTQWTAPDNQTDKDETVRIRIAVSCSNNPALSDERFIDVVVRRKTPIQILGGPSANPNPVDSGGTTKLIVYAKDLESSFPLTYSWTEESSELGDPGRFSTPNDFATDWTAPANLSESDKRVTIKVRIARSTDPSIFVESTVNVIVQPELPYQYYGELQATDFRSVMNQNAYADTFTFKVNSPTTIRIAMFSQFDNYLYLYKGPIPSVGNLIAQNDNYFGTNACLNKVFVDHPGVYSIEASSYCSFMTGPYRLASNVELVPHVQITNGPTATPSVVPSEGSVSLSVEAKDIADDHGSPTYSWEVVESSIGSGSFSDPNIQNPTWIAPPNPGSDARVKIKVRVACRFRPDIAYAEGFVEIIVKGSIPPILSLSPPSFTFTATQGGANPSPQTLEVWNSGRGSMNWAVSKNATWLTLSPTSGSSSGEHDQITVSVNISGLASGTYSATITLSGEGAPNSPQYIPVTLQVNSSKVLNSLAISPLSYTFTSSTPKQFQATAYFSDGSSQAVTSSCSWSSDNPSVATVNSSGLVTPVSNGNTYIRASYTLSGVTKSASSQVTVNISSQPTISGRVTRADNSQGLDGVTITFSNGGGSVTTSGGGYYSKQVPNGWSGRATPSYSGGGSFNPQYRDYTNVTSNQTNQNYTWNNITQLQNGVPVTNLSGAVNSQVHFFISVPSGATNLKISLSGGTGDCDLYVKYGQQASLTNWDYCPWLPGNEESVTISSPSSGDWYIMLHGYASYAGVTLLASYTSSSTPILLLSPTSFYFVCLQGSSPLAATLQIRNSGGGTLNWTVSSNATWLTLSPPSGFSTGEWDLVTVSINASSLSPGTYNAMITVSAPGASNSPQYIPVTLDVLPLPPGPP